jgi:hypothetical protein
MNQTKMSESDLIFISYASPDRERVIHYYEALKAAGYNVWIDIRRQKGGQDWNFEIQRALNRAVLIVVFVSANAVDRRGYAQREIKVALDKAMEKLAGDIYLIPVLLDDDAVIPEELKRIHIIRASDAECEEKLRDAIRHQLESLGRSIAEAQTRANVRWSSSSYQDRWDGLPGYETEFTLIHFSSDLYPSVKEVTDIVRGVLLSSVSNERLTKLSQDPVQFNFGQERFSRTNTWEALPAEPKIKGRVLSLHYNIHWYGAGAAHPNTNFLSFCFMMDPLVRIGRLSSVFDDESGSFTAIQKIVRENLLARSDDDESILPEEWVRDGTADWDSFGCFSFDEDGMELSFAPYQVAAYVFGPQVVKVPYAEFKQLLHPWFRNALGIW